MSYLFVEIPLDRSYKPIKGEFTLHLKDRQIDAIVVGTGPGGATVAKELSQRNQKMLILEWGSNAPLTGSFWQAATGLLVPGKSLLFTNQLLGLARGITTGGSTTFYYATCFPVPFEISISYRINITHEVEEIKKELPVAPLKDEMVGPMAKRIMISAQDLGYNWQMLNKFMYQERWKPEYKFGHYGDPHQVKWSARMYVEEAVADGAILMNGTKVNRVLVEDKTAIGVEFTKRGKKSKALAPKVIISAGGIGTPVILRASGIKGAGRNFFFDPLIGVRGTVRDIKVPASEIPMTAGVHLQDEGYMMTDMAQPFAINAIFATQVFRLDKIFSHRKTLQILVKAKDALGGRLTNGGGVRKNLAIPEAWGLPPTATIIGLGKRLAKHLSGELST